MGSGGKGYPGQVSDDSEASAPLVRAALATGWPRAFEGVAWASRASFSAFHFFQSVAGCEEKRGEDAPRCFLKLWKKQSS